MLRAAATSEAIPVRVKQWRVGDVPLPAGILVVLDMPRESRKFQLQGLLGSDVLSRFHAIEVDYKGKVLTLHPDHSGLASDHSGQ